MVSKINPNEEYRDVIAKLIAVVLLTARGTVFLYQGQEIGAVNVDFADMSEMRDIESINKYDDLIACGKTPEQAWRAVLVGSRDHARTPMQWTDEKFAGFSEHEPWIRVGDKDVRNVAQQLREETSVLRAYQTLIQLRKDHPALVYGSFEPHEAGKDDVFCYYRDDGKERFYIEINLCERAIKQPAVKGEMELVYSNYMAQGDGLQPYEANIYRVNK
jgi:oligo-1,6-glucosidase